jgi:release factor glutamine methyltransferase
MAHALGVKRLDLYLQFDRPLDAGELDRIRELVRGRGARTPVAYLLGEREFFSLVFAVDRRVLVPRPETELLVEVAREHLRACEAPLFCDVGTGSGCVAVALLHELPAARGLAVDLAPGALEVAGANAARHRVQARLALLEGDLLEPLRGGEAWGRLDAVLSNPPYVVRGDPALEEDVRAHEPEQALYVPGDDPLEPARRLAAQALEALAPGGLLALEIGFGSGAEARALLASLGYADVAVHPDLARVERVVAGRAPRVSGPASRGVPA